MRKCLCTYGLLGVYSEKDTVHIEYGGNMGSTLEHSVIPKFEEKYGLMTFGQLQNIGKESGSPSYMYTLTVPEKKFWEVVKTG